jgi:HEAT repeat protein
MRRARSLQSALVKKRVAAVLVACVLVPAACGRGSKGPDVAALLSQLDSPDADTRGKASLAIVRLGEPAVPGLVEMLKSEDPRRRATAASTLFGMGPKARAAVPALAEALSDPDSEMRVSAAMALESVGPDAAPAVPALVRALKDRETVVKQRAAIALGSIGPGAREAVPALAEASRHDAIRPSAEAAIQKIQH